jgi:hypothetical protein
LFFAFSQVKALPTANQLQNMEDQRKNPRKAIELAGTTSNEISI